VRLSIAHTDKPSSASPPAKLFRTWPGAALAIIPAGENLNPNLHSPSSKRGKRGKITTLSAGARTRIKETLSQIKPVPAWTMALTLPNEAAAMSPAAVHLAFQKLARNFTASPKWNDVGLIYKREFQRNGRLHYHFVAYGLRNWEHARQLQHWITERWVKLIERWVKQICHLDSREVPASFIFKMWKVHLHRKNMEHVRKSIASYFAKYLGKDNGAPHVSVPGKWWGKINAKAIPFVEEKNLALPVPVRDTARRMGRKLNAKRVQYGLYKSAMRAAGWIDANGDPVMSLQEFHRARDYRPPADMLTGHFSGAEHRRMDHWEMRKQLIADGYKQGRHNRPRPSAFGKISLVGYGMPETAERIIRHAAGMWIEHRAARPF
jgi:hypothetical protein